MARQAKTRLPWRWFKLNSIWISILLSLAVLTSYVLSRPENRLLPSIDILELLEAKTLDLRFLLRGERKPRDDIVIIAVDEKTEDELGRWQSSGRRWIAKMLDILHEGGAKVVGFDVTFAEPDEGAALEAVEEIKTHLAGEIPPNPPLQKGGEEILTYLDEVKARHDYDRQLAEAIQRSGNIILGIYAFFNRNEAKHLTPEKHEAYRQLINRVKYTMIKFPPGTTQQPPLRIRHSFGVEPNLPMFSETARSFGLFTLGKDPDGYIRRSPLLIEYMGEYYPSLNLEVARAYLNPPMSPIIHALGNENEGIVNGIQLGDLYIPTDEQGNLLINFYGPGRTFPHYSLADVILGKISPETFKDKIVLLGFIGSIYQDVHSAPFQAGTYPGVEVHATIIENILRQDFLTRPEATTLIDALILFLLGIGLGIVLHRVHSLRWELLSAVLSVIVVAAIAHIAFLFWRIWFNMTFPVLFIVLDYLVITSYKYFAEEKKQRIIKHAFEHYVSPAVVKKILETTENPTLGQEQRIMSALFSDIRGFTAISERMSSKELSEFLEEFFTPMIAIIAEHEGTVDKYIGDAIMVFYGAPQEQSDHAIRACQTAVDMNIRVEELRVRWKARGLPLINIGLGINSGEMSVGNIGAKERFDYTILGDNVNLASRLEGVNKQYGTNIIISQFTYDLIGHDAFTVRELDIIRVKGRKEPVAIYELIGYDIYFQQMQALAEMFSKGLFAYRERQWKQAIVLFRNVLQKYPGDKPSKLYIDRCEKYKLNPPPEDWDGVFEMKTK